MTRAEVPEAEDTAGHGRLDRYLSGASFWRPGYMTGSAWIGHGPFVFWLVDALRPREFVELGTHRGYSYFSVCQAVQTLGLATRCLAVDTWKGDAHAGRYGEEIFERVRAHNEKHYAGFSRLHRATFDEALREVEDGSIDLLHIDGQHFYEDVKHDFETWRPKLSERAVVLLHDTRERDRDFGVFRLWEEVSAKFPSFEFAHEHGLGVLGVGKQLPAGVRFLFDAAGDPAETAAIRSAYERLGGSLRAEFLANQAKAALAAKLEQQMAQTAELSANVNHAIERERASAAELAEIRRIETMAGSLARQLKAEEARVSELANQLAMQEKAATTSAARLSFNETQVATLTARLREREREIRRLHRSRSWRFTAPFRALQDQFNRMERALRRTLRGQTEADAAGDADSRQPARSKYRDWIAQNDTLSEQDRTAIRKHISTFRERPKLSILMPVYQTSSRHLRQAIESVRSQIYDDWELCIVDDASPSKEPRTIIDEYAKRDDRIRPFYRKSNGGIASCSDTALDMASGSWAVLMDHDDVLPDHALYLLADAINKTPQARIIYTDQDAMDGRGVRSGAYFKPDWDYTLFLGQNLINHLSAFPISAARDAGGFRKGFDGSQDWDLALRVLDLAPDPVVHHIPFVLYHWRQTGSTFSKNRLGQAVESAAKAVNDHFARSGQKAKAVSVGHSSHLRIQWAPPETPPLVSIIIPMKDKAEVTRLCLDGLFNRTDYAPIEVVIVDNGSAEPATHVLLDEYRARPNVKIIEDRRDFNFSRLVNQGVAASSGEICVLLNNDVDVINRDWLTELVSQTLRPGVGAAGAKLYYGNDTLQHGGVILGIGGVAGHAHRFLPREGDGYFNRMHLAHELSCVTGACIAVRRDVFDEVGGFNEKDLAVSFNDVDFCLRVRRAGHKIVWTPHSELYHYESISRGRPNATPEGARRNRAEIDYMLEQWGELLIADPYYNPNLSLETESFEPALNARVKKPWLEPVADHGGRRAVQTRPAGEEGSSRFASANFVAIHGKSKRGKTTLSRALSALDGFLWIHTDSIFNDRIAPKLENKEAFWVKGHKPGGYLNIGKYVDSDSFDLPLFIRHLRNVLSEQLSASRETQIVLLDGYVMKHHEAIFAELGIPRYRALALHASVVEDRHLVNAFDVTGNRYDEVLAHIRDMFGPGPEAAMPAAAQAPAIASGEAEIVTVRNAVVTKVEFDRAAHKGFGAVYDAGRLVAAGIRPRAGGGWNAADPERWSGPEPERKLESAIYLGHLFRHFGHFLIETLPSLHWAKGHPGPFVMHPASPVPLERFLEYDFINFSLEGLGIPAARIVLAHESLSVATLIVPPRAPPMLPLPATLEVYDRLRNFAGTATGDERVYLSRRKYEERNPPRMVVPNEDEAEAVFVERGFRIVHPESLPFREQVRIAGGAKYLAGLAGSALHLSGFMQKGSTVLVVGNRRLEFMDAVNGARGIATHMLGGTIDGDDKRPISDRIDAVPLRQALERHFK